MQKYDPPLKIGPIRWVGLNFLVAISLPAFLFVYVGGLALGVFGVDYGSSGPVWLVIPACLISSLLGAMGLLVMFNVRYSLTGLALAIVLMVCFGLLHPDIDFEAYRGAVLFWVVLAGWLLRAECERAMAQRGAHAAVSD